MSGHSTWDAHYLRENSVLIYPDECLVRMAAPFLKTVDCGRIAALDLGCGTGRHLRYLRESGVGFITGLDSSHNALRVCRDLYALPLVRADNTSLPFREASFDMVVAWGSLHYARKRALPMMLDEIVRVIKPGGVLLGTLRSDRDTAMRRGTLLGDNEWATDIEDLKSQVTSFYRADELESALGTFASAEYGLMERSALGDTTSIISHWFYRAVK